MTTLVEIMRAHHIVRSMVILRSENRYEQWGQCTGCEFESEPVPLRGVNWETLQRDIYAEHVAEVWREACTITTVEQLDALPTGAIIRAADGDAKQRDDENHLANLYGPWLDIGLEVPDSCDEIPLPSLLLWHPEWSQP